MKAIVFEGVTKRFRRTVALDALDFEISCGRLTALLGPNGAGKTTALRSTMGLCRPDGGRISVMDRRVGPGTSRIVKDVGWVSESGQGLYDKLTAVDNLRWRRRHWVGERNESRTCWNWWAWEMCPANTSRGSPRA